MDEWGRLTILKESREKIETGKLLMLEVCKDWRELRPVSDPNADLEGTFPSGLSFR
ncbi:hypothetical protein KEJ39_01420 [Candidatus Bathyarchaeota archaeon]|nr:hypothetical protein [Candidatus Bathyarchaeota archaeon]